MKIKLLLTALLMSSLTFGYETWTDPDSGIVWNYQLNGDAVTIGTGNSSTPAISKTMDGDVLIPAQINGYSVTCIGGFAFYGCTNITSVTIPSTVMSVDGTAFYKCSGLLSINVDTESESYQSYNGVLFSKDLESLVACGPAKTGVFRVPTKTKVIGRYAFNNSKLTRILLRDGLREILGNAFDGAEISSISIPGSVTSVSSGAFFNSALTSISVAATNGYYSAVNGVLMNKNQTALLAYPGMKDDTPYEIPDSVTEIGNYAFAGCRGITSLIIPSSVTKIGRCAFLACSGLYEVVIPNELQTIETSAFSQCALKVVFVSDAEQSRISQLLSNAGCNMSSVVFSSNGCYPDGSYKNKAYGLTWNFKIDNGLAKITSVTPKSEIAGYIAISETLGYCAVCDMEGGLFSSCTNMISVTIPDTVTNIEKSAFLNCSGLTSVTLPTNALTIGQWAFYGCSSLAAVEMPANITNVGVASFAACFELESVMLSDGLLHIDNSAFSSCRKLSSIVIPTNVVTIGNNAFAGCSNLSDITIPDSVESIGTSAFNGCGILKTVFVSEGSEKRIAALIESSGFDISSVTFQAEEHYASGVYDQLANGVRWRYMVSNECAKIIGISTVPTGNIVIPDTLGYCPVCDICNNLFNGYTKITSVSIPSSVTNIGMRVFANCKGITSITIPGGVKKIGAYAFFSCSGLTHVTFNEGLEEIESYAFYQCENARFDRLPESLKTIGSFAFYRWLNQEKLLIPAGVTSIGVGAFANANSLMSIDVDSGSPYYKSVDGVLLNANGSVLVACGAAKTGTFTIPNSVKVISGWAFCKSKLSGILIPDGVLEIQSSAFGNAAVTSIAIPESVSQIADGNLGAFNGCAASSFSVDAGNPTYSAIDGVLMNKSQTRLIAYPRAKSDIAYLIPETVTDISACAFINSALQSIALSASVTNVGQNAFQYCTNLRDISIPDSIVAIGPSALSGCNNLRVIFVSEAAKEKITAMIEDSGFDISSIAFATDGHYPAGTYTSEIGGLRWSFTVTNGISKITSVYPKPTGNVVVPDMLGYCPVCDLGDYLFSGCYYMTSVSLPFCVTNIGISAFANCSKISDLAIPDSIVAIGSSAFAGCSNLKVVFTSEESNARIASLMSGKGINTDAVSFSTGDKYPDGSYRNTIDALTWSFTINNGKAKIIGVSPSPSDALTIPKMLGNCQVCDIGNRVFKDNSGMTSVEIPISVTNIGYYAFCNSADLTSIEVPKNIAIIGYGALSACGSLTNIEVSADNPNYASVDGVLYDKALTKIVCCPGAKSAISIPNSVSVIGVFAFDSCKAIESIVMPDGVQTIEDRAFNGCEGLSYIDIPAQLRRLGTFAFAGCSGLTSIEIPAGVTHIGNGAFESCAELTNIEVSANNAYYVSINGVLYDKGVTKLISCPGGKNEIAIPNSVGEICDNALYGCCNLAQVDIPESVTNIGNSALALCDELTNIAVSADNEHFASVDGVVYNKDVSQLICFPTAKYSVKIPNSVTNICKNAFFGCNAIASISIPSTVAQISSYGFNGNANLSLIEFDGNAPVIGANAFLAMSSGAVVRVHHDSIGWGVAIPGKWNGMRIVYDDPIPDMGTNPTSAEIATVLGELSDAGLAKNITDVDMYEEYRIWANSVKEKGSSTAAGVEVVKAAPNAWLSFALGCDTLIDTLPKSENLRIEFFAPTEESGKFDFYVGIDDVDVSSEAYADNLKKVFGVIGGSSMEDMSSDNVDITFDTPVDGLVKFTAGPNAENADAKTFFMTVKIK